MLSHRDNADFDGAAEEKAAGMANIMEIRKYPAEILRVKCKPVKKIDDEIRSILEDMLFTMHAHNGVGLAAPQVGIDRQIIVVDAGEGLVNLINPKIIEKSGTSSMEEGCLSLPEVVLKVKRAASIKVKALDEKGLDAIINAKGLLSTVIQHEIDHINGVLIIDRANVVKKHFLKNKLLKNKEKAKII